MKNLVSHSNYRPDVQGLRAIAVLLVVIYHSGIGYFPGGYIGVDIFFVISGYLITGLLHRELEHSGSVDFMQFYAKRIRRLLPAVTVVLITTVIAAWYLYSPLEMKQFSSSAFATSIYLSNAWFAHLAMDYLAESASANPLLHTWSLSVEEQFYFVWPLFIFILARTGGTTDLYKKLLKGIFILSVLSFIFSVLLTKYNQPWAFFSSPTRAWEFGVGGLIVLIPKNRFNISVAWSNVLGVLGFSLVLFTACFYDTTVSFPGFAAVLPVLGAASLLAAGHGRVELVGVNRWMCLKPMQFVGNISYSLYLWHWPIFVFMDFLYVDINILDRLGALLLAFFLAWVTVISIENPFRFSKLLINKVNMSIMLGILLLVLSASFSLVLRDISKSSITTPSQLRYSAAKNDIPRTYPDGCHAQFLQVDMPDCVYGDQLATRSIVLFGDSHAAQWFPALEELSKLHHWQLIPITKTSCPSMSFEPFDNEMNRTYIECTQWREKAFARIEKLKPQLVVLANSKNYLTTNGEGVLAQNDAKIWQKSVRETLDRLSSNSTTSLVILRDTPWLKFNAPICLSRADWQQKSPIEMCRFNTIDTKSKEIFELERHELEGTSKGLMIDMSSVICPDQECATERDGLVIYHDAHHLSASFSKSMAHLMYSKLKPMLTVDEK